MRGVKVGNFEYCAQPLELGQLAGNRFSLLMRDCRSAPAAGAAQAGVQECNGAQEVLEEQVGGVGWGSMGL